MRAVFVGASSLSVTTAQLLLKHKNEVVIIDQDKTEIEHLMESMDCGFLLGDGSKPAILKEADPGHTDILFCLTGDDKANILASLVGRSLGFKRVVTKIEDAELEHVCLELGLEDTIVPSRTIGRFLADMSEGQDPLELSTMIRDEARIFSFVLPPEFSGTVLDLELPEEARAICIYRGKKFMIANDELELKAEDEIVVIAHREKLATLIERWQNFDDDKKPSDQQ
jgi:trk system potassium uptake protein TrkA